MAYQVVDFFFSSNIMKMTFSLFFSSSEIEVAFSVSGIFFRDQRIIDVILYQTAKFKSHQCVVRRFGAQPLN